MGTNSTIDDDQAALLQATLDTILQLVDSGIPARLAIALVTKGLDDAEKQLLVGKVPS